MQIVEIAQVNAPKSELTRPSLIALAVQELGNEVAAGNRLCIEELLRQFPSLGEDCDSLFELIYTEYAIRSELSDSSHDELVAEFQARFPEHREELKQLFEVGQVISTLVAPPSSSITPGQNATQAGDGRELIPSKLGGYTILEELGQGGMGIVYKAVQHRLDRVVALKTSDCIKGLDRRTIAQLTREAELASQLQHPNIVQIFEVGTDDGTPYFSMEFVSGGTLADAIRHHPLTPEVAAKLVAVLARAVAHAHDRGILHRDLKPSNILLSPSDRLEALPLSKTGFEGPVGPNGRTRFEPKVADFGLAIDINESNGRTRALGTPSYMAPEQIDTRFGQVGVGSDVYSLGAVLFHCLAGRPPFQAPTLKETLQQVQEEEVQPLSTLVRRLPRDLETISHKCLQKSPENRYASAWELAEDLERYLTLNPIRAKAPGALERAIKWSRRHPTITTLIVCSLMVASAATYFWRTEAQRATLEVQARQRAEQMLYGNRIALATSALQSHDLELCREILQLCDPVYREWEWNYLNATASEAIFESTPKPLRVNSVAISHDGRLVVGGFGKWGENFPQTIDVWDAPKSELLWSLAGHPPSDVASVRFNHDASRLLSCAAVSSGGEPGGVLEWDMKTGKLIRNLSPVNARVAEYSPDGKLILVGTTRGQVQIFDALTGKLVKTLRGHDSIVLSLAFGPEDRLITTSRDGLVCLWSLQSGLLDRLHEMGDPRQVVWHHDGKTVWVQGYSGVVQEFAVENETFRLLRTRQSQSFSRIAIAPDHLTYAIAGFGQGVEIRKLKDDQLIRQIHGHRGEVRAIGFDARAQHLISGGSDGVLRVWDLQRSPTPTVNYVDGGGSVADCASHPQKRELALAIRKTTSRSNSFSGQPRLEIRDVDSMRLLRSANCHANWLTSVAYSPSGKLLASGSLDGTVVIWSNDSLEQLRTFAQHPGPIQSLDFINENFVVSLDEQGQCYVWDWHNGSVIHSEHVQSSTPELTPLVCAIRELAVATQQIAVVIPHAKSSEVQIKRAGEQFNSRQWEVPFRVSTIAHNKRLNLLAIAGFDGNCWVYDLNQLAAKEELKPVEISIGKELSIISLDFNPNGTRLCSAGDDETVRLFDSRLGTELIRLEAQYRYDSIITFSCEGDVIYRFAGRQYQSWNNRGQPKSPDQHWALNMSRLALAAENPAATRFYCQLATAEEGEAQAARELMLRMTLYQAEPSACDLAYQELLENHPSSRSSDILRFLVQRGKHQEVQQRLKQWREPDLLEDPIFVNSMAWYAALINADQETLRFWGDRLHANHQRKKQVYYANTLGLVEFRLGHWDEGYKLAAESLKLGGELAAPLDWLIQLQCLTAKAHSLDASAKKTNMVSIVKQAKTALAALAEWNKDRQTTLSAQVNTSQFREQIYRFETPIILATLRQQIDTSGPLSNLSWEILDSVLPEKP